MKRFGVEVIVVQPCHYGGATGMILVSLPLVCFSQDAVAIARLLSDGANSGRVRVDVGGAAGRSETRLRRKLRRPAFEED